MLEGLDHLFADSAQPGLTELRASLADLFAGGSRGCLFETRALPGPKPLVFRLRFRLDREERSVVVKRLKPAIAERNKLALQRWLPAVGLGAAAPALLSVAAGRDGDFVWHVYEDLGPGALDPESPAPLHVQPVVTLIAQLHTRCAVHPMLAECRPGGDLGPHFYATSVRDAIRCLTALQPPEVKRSREQAALCERLLERLHRLDAQRVEREQLLADLGGPDTLLHGDLWTPNAFVVPGRRGLEARLIDWDHVGVGSYSYDLSTFLLRFASRHRPWILDLYRTAVAVAGWRLPAARDLNPLFETAEYARYANCIIWPALALLSGPNDWSFKLLAEIEGWFQKFQPVLNPDDVAPAPRPVCS
jgi:hypothetical protein